MIEKLNIDKHEDYKDFFTEKRIKELEKIMEEVEKDIFFPNLHNIFRFTSVPIKDIKCIFIGQDAYPSYKIVDVEEIQENATEDLENIVITENNNLATETIIIEKDWEKEKEKEKKEERERKEVDLPYFEFPVFIHDGYVGSIRHDDKYNILYGRLLNIKEIISYYGKDMAELSEDFKKAIEVHKEILSKNEKAALKEEKEKALSLARDILDGKVPLISEERAKVYEEMQKEDFETIKNVITSSREDFENRLKAEVQKALNDKDYFEDKDNIKLCPRDESKFKITFPSGHNKTHPRIGTFPLFNNPMSDIQSDVLKIGTERFKDDTTKYFNLHISNDLRNKLKIEMDYDDTPVMTYKGYKGSIKYNEEDDILYGEIRHINHSINYHGSNIEELRKSFEKAVDDLIKVLPMLDASTFQVLGPSPMIYHPLISYPHDIDDDFDDEFYPDDDDIDSEDILENIEDINLKKYINGILIDESSESEGVVSCNDHQNTPIETPKGLVIPEATGRSFEVNSMMTWTDKIKQSSLRNILKSLYYLEKGEKKSMKEIREEIFSGNFSILPPHEWFNYLEEQGVIFLNTSLTVKMDKAGSHLKLWESFMNDLVRYINGKNPEIKWILAGKVSQERIFPLISYSIQTDHPRLDSFVTQCPFKQVDGVDWIGNKKEK